MLVFKIRMAKPNLPLLPILVYVTPFTLSLVVLSFYFTGLSLYDSTKDFTCLDGSLTISFSSINDDYCDCPDGTDEPGESVDFVLLVCARDGYSY